MPENLDTHATARSIVSETRKQLSTFFVDNGVDSLQKGNLSCHVAMFFLRTLKTYAQEKCIQNNGILKCAA